MIEFEVGGHRYKASPLNAKMQWNVARRLAPVMAGMAGAEGENIFTQIAKSVSGLSDADSDYVIDAVLATVLREQGADKGWASVMTKGGAMMFDDIDMAAMLQIVFRVLQEQLSGFFTALLSLSADQPETGAP